MTGESNSKAGKVQTFLALVQREPTEMDCQRCSEQVAAYVDVQLAGKKYREQFPAVALHLDGCVSCAELYGRVYEVALVDKNGRLPQLSHIPQPDLRFLSQPSSLWAVLQTALHQTQTRFTLHLNAALAALLTPPPTLAPTRSDDNGRFGNQILSLTPAQVPETDFPFSLVAYADKENPDHCLVEITVEPPGLSWPDLGGSSVKVSYGDVVLAEVTDDWGTAVFANIPRAELENLHIEIHTKQI